MAVVEPAAIRAPRLSVVIPTWNRAALVIGALEHLLSEGSPDWAEVLVVDDGSTDDTAERVGREFPSVVLIRRQQNGGFGAAVNTGFQAAYGDYLATLNNDARVSWSSLATLVEFLQATPGAAAASPSIRDEDGIAQRTAFAFPRGPLGWIHQKAGGRSSHPVRAPERADYLRGACLVFRREALENVGLFDEQFFMFAEELDLFRRLAGAGWEAWVVPAAVAEHFGGRSSRAHEDLAIASRFRRMSYRSMSRYYRKHHAWPEAALLRSILAARVSGRLARALVRSALTPAERWWVREHAGCLANVIRPSTSHPHEPQLTRRIMESGSAPDARRESTGAPRASSEPTGSSGDPRG